MFKKSNNFLFSFIQHSFIIFALAKNIRKTYFLKNHFPLFIGQGDDDYDDEDDDQPTEMNHFWEHKIRFILAINHHYSIVEISTKMMKKI